MKKTLFFLFSLLCTESAFAQTPVLNSNPTSSYVLLIDPDGYTDESGWWGGGTVVAASAGYSAAQVTEVFTRVAEDFRPFDINVTTDETVFQAAPVSNRQRVVLTPSDGFYNTGTTNAGGVAYLNTFGGGDISCWVFTNKMGGLPANTAEAASHELGHTLGLNHHALYNADCSLNTGYHGGQGSGQTSWGPIMGAAYGRTITQWYNGAANGSTCSSYYQDDFKIITTNNGFTYKTDDVGDTRPLATTLTLSGGTASYTGLISTNTDVDVFRFTVSVSGVYSFSVSPNAYNGSSYSGANLDARVTISNSAGTVLTDAQPTSTLNATTNLYLNPGDYYVTVDGAGIAGYIVTGGLGPEDYGSVGQYSLTLNTVACAAGVLTTTAGERCGTGAVTLSASSGTGTISWFAASSGGTALGTGTSFTTPSVSATTSYYVEFTNGTCTSSRVPVNAIISYPPVLPPITGSNTVQAGTPLQLSNPFQGGTWSTSNASIATVSTTGLVMPLAAGSVTISYSATSGSCAAASVSLGVTITSPQPCVGVPTVSDADGNIYNTIQIGGQCWTKENLKTSKYADNSVITGVTLDASWSALSTGAWASYSNNGSLEASYGKLYNQFAVSDSRLLCPVGWHIPDSSEILPLLTYLGGNQVAGGKMKQVSALWSQPNISGTNYSGFSGLPGGQRDASGLFSGVGTYAGFWTKTVAGSNGVQFTLLNSSAALSTSFISRKAGLSVRCVQDNGGTGTGPRILEAISGSRCGPGILILQATASGGEVNWFSSPQGGTAMAVGTYFTTPELTQTTTYYVAAVSGTLSSARTPVYAIVNPAFDPGSLSAGDQTICNGGDPAMISFGVSPAGATAFTYQWYYQDAVAGCPSGTSLTGWTAISGATSSSYDPPSGLTTSRSYAVFVSPVAGVGSVVCGEAQWAPVCRKVIVLPAVVYGTLAAGNQSITYPADPASISFSSASSGGADTFTYQWYYQAGIIAAPTGGTTTGWTLIQGATLNSYDPPSGLTASRSYACLVTPGGSPLCGTATWASGVRQITVTPATINPGILATGNQSLCNGGDPAAISFATAPSGGTGFGYQWYYQNGIIAAPTGNVTTGWTLIAGATASSYDPAAGLTSSRTYACLVSATGATSAWASGVRQITILSVPTFGVLAASNQSLTAPADPVSIAFSTAPAGGSGTFTYQWYYQSGIIAAPTGSVLTGWTLIQGATTNSYDPPAGLTGSRSYACFVTPAGSPVCGTATWASGVRQITVTPGTINPGILAAGNQSLCNGGDPAAISFSTVPSGGTGFGYLWYYQDGIIAAPTGNVTTGWTLIAGATASSYDPPAGLTTSRTYACLVSATGATSAWASGVRQITILSVPTFGVLAAGNQSLNSPADPASITFSTAAAGGSGAFTYQWYFQDGIVVAPTESVLTGWTAISGATTSTYDPPAGLTVSRSYACFVTPAGSPVCGTATWASGVRQITVTNPVLNPGILASGNQTICNAGDPASIAFSTAPSGPAGIGYQWYFQDGIVAAPTGVSTNGWTLIAGATASSYDPSVGLISNRSYACLVSGTGVVSTWASGVRQVTVLPVFTPGIITAGDQSFCGSGDPANITLLQNPTGSGAYTWRWYFRETSTGSCPTGSTVPAGWNTNSTSNNITGTTTTGAGISFDPISAGAVNVGRTFAVLITPIANGSIPACGTPQWAESCRKMFVTSCSNFVAGTLANGNETICNGGDPSNVAFSVAPSGGTGYGYQWYYQDGIAAAPTGSVTTGWTIINGATASAYNAPSGLTNSRSYTCLVSATGVSAKWATGVRQVTVLTPVSNGSISNGNESQFAPADPADVSLASLPTGGSGVFTYQWYYQDGIAAAPTGGSVTGWNIIPNATTSSYDPPAGLLASRSYACLISPAGSPVCGGSFWTSGVRQVTVTSLVVINPGSLATGNQTICNGGDPNAILFGTAPSGIASFTFQWYYQDGIVNLPAGNNTTGWTLISGASANSYDPPSGLTASRTFACLVSGSGAVSAWASVARQVTVLPVFNPGAIAAGDQTFCNSGNPANITMSVDPVGSGGYQWKWWYFENANAVCPTTSGPPAGWLTNSTSTNISGTTLTGAGVMFDPISAGSVGSGRTFAVLITPIANGAIPACGTPKFATTCRKLFVNACRQQGAELASDLVANVQFSVVPNPVSDVFSLMATGLERDQLIRLDVVDATGKRIFSKEEILVSDELKLDASGWAKGMYQLVIRTRTGIWTERFVK